VEIIIMQLMIVLAKEELQAIIIMEVKIAPVLLN
jgi:hypothetical protein